MLVCDLFDGTLTRLSKSGLLLRQLIQSISICPHLIVISEQFLIHHLEGLALPVRQDKLVVFIIHILVHFLHIVFETFDTLLKSVGEMLILSSLRSEILANHTVFIEQVLVSQFDRLKIFFQPIDIFLLRRFHLF